MSLFRKAGETFEKTKRRFVDDDGGAYACESCEARLDEDHEYCPQCGEETVVPAE